MSLVFFHITDLHIKQATNAILYKIESLKHACKSIVKPEDDVFFILLGIGFSGKEEEYNLCFEYIETVRDYIKQKVNIDADIIMIPETMIVIFPTRRPSEIV
jgi:hypothetical protein